MSLQRHQLFVSRKEAVRAIQDMALADGKRAVVDLKRSGGRYFVMKCASPTSCTFQVRVLKCSEVRQGFWISSLNTEHLGCTGVAKPTQYQVHEFKVVRAAIHSNARVPAGDVIRMVADLERVVVPKRMMYRAKDLCIDATSGSYSEGYNLLSSLLQRFDVLNGCTSLLKWEDGVFWGAMICNPLARTFRSCVQHVTGIDGAHMKHRQYNGVMLVLIGRDGNNHNIVLAVGLVPSETAEAYDWFLQGCHINGINLHGIPVFCDRGSAILASRFSELKLIHCTRHIVQNVKTVCSSAFNVDLQRLLWDAQRSPTCDSYLSALRILSLKLPRAADYVEAIDPGTWALYPHLHTTPLYGWRTTNFVEAANSEALPARSKDPYHFFVHQMDDMMTTACTHKKNARIWREQGRVVTPHAQCLLDSQEKLAPRYQVYESSETVLYIKNPSKSASAKRRVDIAARTCTCGYVLQMGVPCRHIIRALMTTNRMCELYDCFADFYKNVDRIWLPRLAASRAVVPERLDAAIAEKMVRSA
ncbi:hypothetical protein ACHHYP_13875 [Achlya hypogyna]|uniref:SWIM-type domain-containing protein n=1 Tax=Achlya hypogyna TaxID=1202772 RepID=A0A1V9YEK4_ACHHY|nr:hypothetical protein ACHHYP_13875 [Achlya hypogyna]